MTYLGKLAIIDSGGDFALGGKIKRRMGLEERVARIEGILEQMNERFNHLESRIRALEDRINALDARINALSDKLDSHFRWTVALFVTMWVTVIAAVLFK